MNPDKLFNYLDGKLSSGERRELEQQLTHDSELQRELSMARRIHGRMTDESREVLLDDGPTGATQGRQIIRRIVIVFIVLLGINVLAGLWLIAHREMSNPNRKLLENQMREELTKSLDHAAQSNMTPPPFEVGEKIMLAASAGKLDAVADAVIVSAKRLGGSATKELPDNHRIGVLVDVPANRETEFRGALATISGGLPASPSPSSAAGPNSETKSFVIQIVEPGAPQD